MFKVELLLQMSSTICFINRAFHASCHNIGKHQNFSVLISCRTTNCLNECPLASEKALFVRIKNCNHAYFGQVKSFSQKIYAHQHIKFTTSQRIDYFNPFNRINFGVHIFCFDSMLAKISRQTLRHLFG